MYIGKTLSCSYREQISSDKQLYIAVIYYLFTTESNGKEQFSFEKSCLYMNRCNKRVW